MLLRKGQVITLTPQEMYLGSMVGVRRRITSMFRGGPEQRDLASRPDGERWFYNVVGALGELAFAKGANCYWPASVDAAKDEPDVCPNWQVRCLGRADYDLLIRKDDPEQFNYVLMTGKGNRFQFHGWIAGAEAKQPQWFFDRGGIKAPAYWVPQSALSDISSPLQDRLANRSAA